MRRQASLQSISIYFSSFYTFGQLPYGWWLYRVSHTLKAPIAWCGTYLAELKQVHVGMNLSFGGIGISRHGRQILFQTIWVKPDVSFCGNGWLHVSVKAIYLNMSPMKTSWIIWAGAKHFLQDCMRNQRRSRSAYAQCDQSLRRSLFGWVV